jgi:hypothetical protein
MTMEAIFAWTEEGPEGEGVIATMLPFLDNKIALLQNRNLDLAQKFRPFAEAHQRASGHTVRLVRYLRDEVLETIDA